MSLPESKYLSKFNKLRELGEIHQLRGGRVEVEVLPEVEIKSKGGLIIQTTPDSHRSSVDMNRVIMGIVLNVGTGYRDQNGEQVEIDLKPGNVVELSRMGIRHFSTHSLVDTFANNELALIHESEIARVFPNIEAWMKAREIVNGN
jgi:co-chaperonin GroES (HSP10)